ncbi:hypothetical protein TYRP_018338 [Tyrophagus putrescentiae]|nr:hypothetical protein TYRP_018338 [Tyrophagus putrescentiae]
MHNQQQQQLKADVSEAAEGETSQLRVTLATGSDSADGGGGGGGLWQSHIFKRSHQVTDGLGGLQAQDRDVHLTKE